MVLNGFHGDRMNKWLVALLFVIPEIASAQAPENSTCGFLTGLLHPIIGFDYLVAVVAVGLWGSFLVEGALWILSIVFPSIMAVGAALGIVGFEIPLVEFVIALSGGVLGALISLCVRAPTAIAMVLVGIFAIFHGCAHGFEMPEQISAMTYSAGFVIGIVLLHLAGITIGFITLLPRGERLVRGYGGVTSVIGSSYLVG